MGLAILLYSYREVLGQSLIPWARDVDDIRNFRVQPLKMPIGL